MSSEDIRQDNWEEAGQGGTGGEDNATPAERIVGVAKDQATEAAGAFRRGEFMSDPTIDPNASSDDRLIALLSYVTQILIPVVMPVIVLLSESSKQRPFQRYHAVQSLALTIGLMGFGMAVIAGTAFLSVIPLIGWAFRAMGFLMLCLAPIGILMIWTALGYYGYQAYQGKRFAIPGLTSFLYDQGWLTQD